MKENIKNKIANVGKGVRIAVASLGLLGIISSTNLPPVSAERRAKIEATNLGIGIQVRGYATDPSGSGTDYIGLTIDTNDNGRFDIDDTHFRPKIVSKGKFRETFNLMDDFNWDTPPRNLQGKDYTVALWDEILYNCGCRWCDKEGYCLEGELARDYR